MDQQITTYVPQYAVGDLIIDTLDRFLVDKVYEVLEIDLEQETYKLSNSTMGHVSWVIVEENSYKIDKLAYLLYGDLFYSNYNSFIKL